MSTNIRISVGKSPPVHLLQCNIYIDIETKNRSRMNDFAVCRAIASIFFFKKLKFWDLKMGDDSPNTASWKISARKGRTITPENLTPSLLIAVVKTRLQTYTGKSFPLQQSPGMETGCWANTECLTHTAGS